LPGDPILGFAGRSIAALVQKKIDIAMRRAAGVDMSIPNEHRFFVSNA
jgi:hypothetical protein